MSGRRARLRAVFLSSFLALAGFGLAFALAFFVGVSVATSSECDGPCFSRWDDVLWISLGIGLVSGAALGVAVWRRCVRPKGPQEQAR